MKQHVLNLLKETAYQVWSIAKWELILCTVATMIGIARSSSPEESILTWLFCITTLILAVTRPTWCSISIVTGGLLYLLAHNYPNPTSLAYFGAYFTIQFLLYQKLFLPAVLLIGVDTFIINISSLKKNFPDSLVDVVFFMSLIVLVGVARYNYTERIARITIENKTNQEQAAQKISSILHDTLSRELNQIIRLATQIQQDTPTLQAAQINELANHAIDDLHHIIGAITTQSTLPDRTPKLAPSSQLTLNQIATELRQLGFTVNQEGELPQNLPPHITPELHLALNEILANIIKYSDTTSPVTITSKTNPDQCTINISNTIDGKNRNIKSHGLGLPSIKKRLANIGGSVIVKKQPNSWTTALTFPISNQD